MTKGVGKNISNVSKKIIKFMNNQLIEHHLGDRQLSLLINISRDPGISQDKLSHLNQVDKATITKTIKKLEKTEYIYKKKDENDKRIYKLFCTKKALDLLPELMELIDFKNQILMKNVDIKDIEIFYRVLITMDYNLNDFFENN